MLASKMAKSARDRDLAFFNLAVVSKGLGRHSETLKYLGSVSNESMRSWPAANIFLGVTWLQSEEPAKAVEPLRRAQALAPGDLSVYNHLANAYYALSHVDDALLSWQTAVERMPHEADAHLNVALLQREMGPSFWAGSERSYRTACRLKPTAGHYRYSFGNLLYDQGRLAEAGAAYRAALRLEPDHADALNNLANSLRLSGQLVAARLLLERGLQRHPSNTNLLLNAGQVYQDMGLVEQCDEVADRAFALNPRVPEASILRGSVAYARGELASAADHYRVALAVDPASQQAQVNLGNTLGDLYRGWEARVGSQGGVERARMQQVHRECLEAYAAALRLRPDDAEAYLNLAWARKYACDWDGWDGLLQGMESAVRSQLAAGLVPSLKPFQALAFPLDPHLYLAVAEAHAAEEARKAVPLRALAGPLPPPPPPAVAGPGCAAGRLRLGYMSTDFGDHPVGHQAWFWAHAAQFHVVLFALATDDGSAWWRNCSRMVAEGDFVVLGKPGRDVSAVSLAQHVNRRAIHVLITLNGWTSGNQVGVLIPLNGRPRRLSSSPSTSAPRVVARWGRPGPTAEYHYLVCRRLGFGHRIGLYAPARTG